MDLRILGPIEANRDGRPVALGPRSRTLLAALAIESGRSVPAARLVDIVWGDPAPSAAGATLRSHIRRLRLALEPFVPPGRAGWQVIVTRGTGYALRIPPESVDAHRFTTLLAEGARLLAAGDPSRAVNRLTDALALWRGPALAEVAGQAFAVGEAARLEGLRRTAAHARADALLAAGRATEAVHDLDRLVADYPYDERLRCLLASALYRCDRVDDAATLCRESIGILRRRGIAAPAIEAVQRDILNRTLTPEPAQSAPRPAQLPADVHGFTGRAEQLDELDRLAAGAPRAVVVSALAGAAGVGKTALAVHWAHRVRAGFPDGQLYVNLRGYGPAAPMHPVEALAGFLRALGMAPARIPTELDEAAALYRSLLSDRRVLVLLDNARDPEQVRPLLPGAPGCLVLVTSRDSLGGLVARDGARRMTLDVLGHDEAYQLLSTLLGADRVAGEEAATRELAALCAYLPLALRICAANLADGHHTVGAHATALRGGGLAALAVDGDPQTAVRTAFHGSYTRLPAAEQRLFRLFGLVPGPDATAEACAALAGIEVADAARQLARLAHAHLVDEPEAGRYRCHDLLRRYAQERAAEVDGPAAGQAAVDRLMRCYLGRVDAAARVLYGEVLRLPLQPDDVTPNAFDGPAVAAAWLEAERANLVAAVVHAAGHGPRRWAWLLSDALRGYFQMCMHGTEWRVTAEAGLRAAQAEDRPRAQAAAQLSLGSLHFQRDDRPAAIASFDRALDAARAVRWSVGEAAALGNLGAAYCMQGQLETAADLMARALAINQRLGNRGGQAINLGNLGGVRWEMGQPAAAAEHAEQALALFRAIGARGGEANMLENLGECYYVLGRLDEALTHLNGAAAVQDDIGDRRGRAGTSRNLALVRSVAGRHDEALELARTAVTLARDNRGWLEAHSRNVLATVLNRLGDDDQAIEEHRHALRLAREGVGPYDQIEAHIGLAASHRHLGRHDEAWDHARHAATLVRETSFHLLKAVAVTELAACCLGRGQPDRAAGYAQEALPDHRAAGYRLGEADTLVVLGHARPGEAAGHWRDALALYADIGAARVAEVRALICGLGEASVD